MTRYDTHLFDKLVKMHAAINAEYAAEIKTSAAILANATRTMLISASVDVAKVPFVAASFTGGRITAVAQYTTALSEDVFQAMDLELRNAETSNDVSKALLKAALTIDLVSLPEGGGL